MITLPDVGSPTSGTIAAVLEGDTAVVAGDVVYLSGATFDARGVPRLLKVTKATNETYGKRLVAKHPAAVGARLVCLPWQVVSMDTSGGGGSDTVYLDASGDLTLTAVGNRAVGFALGTPATAEEGGAALLCPGPLDEVLQELAQAAQAAAANAQEDADYAKSRILSANVSAPNVPGGGTASALVLDVTSFGFPLTAAVEVTLVAVSGLYTPVWLATHSATATFGAATVGSITASGAGWAQVLTNDTGDFACTLSNSADETLYVRAITSQGGAGTGYPGVVAFSNSDPVTWSA